MDKDTPGMNEHGSRQRRVAPLEADVQERWDSRMRDQFSSANATFATGQNPDLYLKTGPSMPPKPSKNPSWAEIGLEQKVERLRDEVAALRVRSEWWVSETLRLQEMIERFIGHSHDALGHVVVPFRSRYDGAGMAGKSESQFDPLA